MPAPLTPERVALEWKILCSLCDAQTDPTSRFGISLALEAVHFHDPANRIVYEEIRALGSMANDRFCELLPARVNNRGVPDFDFARLFSADNPAIEDPEEMARAIRALRDFE